MSSDGAKVYSGSGKVIATLPLNFAVTVFKTFFTAFVQAFCISAFFECFLLRTCVFNNPAGFFLSLFYYFGGVVWRSRSYSYAFGHERC